MLKSIIILIFFASYNLSFTQVIPNFSGTPSTAGCAAAIVIMPSPNSHEIEFKGVIYDFPNAGQSTWLYKVTTASGKKIKKISHTSFPINLNCNSVVNSGGLWAGKYNFKNGTFVFDIGAGNPSLISPDPKTGVIGLKFDEGFDSQTTAYYFYVLSSKPDISTATVAVKAGNKSYSGSICSPHDFGEVPITVSGLDSHYETDDAVVNFTIEPVGAILNGPGVNGSTFDPHIAGGGTIILDIEYVQPGGCGVQNDTIQIHIDCTPKSVSIAGLDTHYYMYDPIVNLVGTPQGGVFSGPGISGNIFKANVAGLGDHYVYYTYYDAPNCVWVDSSSKITVECCDVPIIVDGLPNHAELDSVKPDDFTPIILKAYPKGGQFQTTSMGLTIIEAKGDSAVAEFDIYEAGPGTHSIEYSLGAESCTTFEDIAIAEIDGSSPLAVELLELSAEISDGIIKLQWRTASETDNDFFTIERSSDLNTWIEIGTVKGAGNSNQENYYELFDNAPADGMNYYKLTQTDYDGLKEVFDLVYVNFQKISNNLIVEEVYPNPANDNINLKLKSDFTYGQITIDVVDIFGRIVIKQLVEVSAYELISTVSLYNIEKGFYFLRVYTENEKPVTIKFMKE